MIGIWNRGRNLLPRQDWLVLGWVLAIKVLLFVFGVEGYRILENKPLPSPLGWLQIWSRWDALHYLQIAQFGYAKTGVTTAFYPLFPWAVRFLAQFTAANYLIAAFVVATVASIFAAVLLRRLVAIDYSGAVATRSVWFLLIFPTAHFLHIGYSESLFLALALASILAARRNRWWLAGITGACCWMSRPPGIVLVPTLMAEAIHQYYSIRRWNWRWLWIGIVPAGFAVYLLINWYISGDPFAFFEMRKRVFIQTYASPLTGIRGAIGNLNRSPCDAEMVGRMELCFVILGFICAVVSWFKLRPVYAVWITGTWALYSSVSFLQSTPRYTLTMFPIFILFALVTRNRFWLGVITVCCLLFLALFAGIYVRGWWAF